MTVMEVPGKRRTSSWANPNHFARGSIKLGPGGILRQLVFPSRSHRTRPTKSGVMLFLLSVGIGTAAYNTSSNILYLTLAMMLSSLLLSGLLSWINFKGTRWRLELDPHMRAGQPGTVTLNVDNAKKRIPTFGLSFIVRAKANGQEALLPIRGSLPPSGSQTLEWQFKPIRRGVEQIEMVAVESLFPFGFLRKSITGGGTAREAIIWPALIEYQFNPSGEGHLRRTGRTDWKRGDGTEITSLRNYRHGDPMRQIHWKATARTGKLLVRETAEEQNAAYAVWIDPASSQWRNGEQFERLCSFAATLAEQLFIHDKLAAWAIGDGPFVTVRRLADVHALLDALSRLEPSQGMVAPPSSQYPIITFRPGLGVKVYAHVDGQVAGEA